MNYIEQFLKDNDIEINEEFYIFNERGVKIQQFTEERGKYQEKFYFNEYMGLMTEDCVGSYDRILRNLMSGQYRIEKITQRPKSVCDLKYGDEYYYIDICGCVIITSYDGYDMDKRMIEFGNAFLTEEEAEFEAERRKCEAILLKYGTRNMMILGDINAHKYFIVYNNYSHEISISFYQSTNSQGTIYFKTEELAQKAIDEVTEDRLKKYIFNVKE